MKNALIVALVLFASGCDPLGKGRCRAILSECAALQRLVNEAEQQAKKRDAAAFSASLARVEARVAEVRVTLADGSDKFRVQSAIYSCKQVVSALPETIKALKELNASVAAQANSAEIKAAAARAGELIDASVRTLGEPTCS